MQLNLPSPIESYSFRGRDIFVKRDDQIDNDFSGNKARKFHYFLDNDFSEIDSVVSYGSSQSNAMYSLSVLSKMRGWRYEYFVDHIPSYLADNPHGNYAKAIDNGMSIIEGELPTTLPSSTLMIEEGGRQAEAEYGIAILADEIVEWADTQGYDRLNVFLPSGTGTTALFLQRNLPEHIRVYSCACVGGDEYLRLQFDMLNPHRATHPEILSIGKKHHFGKLYRENWKIWLELRDSLGIEFDLLYDPLGWRVMMEHEWLCEAPLLYIHQGGVLGNESMIPRYERKYKDMR